MQTAEVKEDLAPSTGQDAPACLETGRGMWSEMRQEGQLELRGRTEQGGWEGRVARGARPGDRKQSSPERAAPGRTGHTWAAVPQAWCGPHRGQGRQAGGQPLGPGACAESRASSDAAALMAQQPAALAPGGHQLRSSGNRASPARRHEKLIPRPEAHACTYATPTHTLGRHDTRDKARPCRRPQSFS